MQATISSMIARRVALPVLVAGAALAGTAHASVARPAAFTSCPGKYTATVKANEKNPASKKWKSTASKVTEQGTTCSNAKAVAGQFTRKSCGSCKTVHKLNGVTYKQKYDNDSGGTLVTGTKGGYTVTFTFNTFPKGNVF